MNKLLQIVLLLAVALVVHSKIDEQTVHNRRSNFQKLSSSQKAAQLEKLAVTYKKKHPKVDHKKVKHFLAVQYFSNVHSKKVVALYASTFLKRESKKCIFSCLVKKLGKEKVKEISKKCRRDFKCWEKETGETGVSCRTETGLQHFGKHHSRRHHFGHHHGRHHHHHFGHHHGRHHGRRKHHRFLRHFMKKQNNDIQCIIRCIRTKLDFQEYLRISLKCRYEADCWKEEAAEHYDECEKQCGGSSSKDIEKTPMCVVKCLAKSLKSEKFRKLFGKCKMDFQCWIKETGEIAKKCIEKCNKNEKSSETTKKPKNSETQPKAAKKVETQPKKQNNDIQCIIRCIRTKLDFQEYLRISLKCRYEADCWKEEAAEHYDECEKQCGDFQEYLRISLKCRYEADCWKEEAAEHYDECEKQCGGSSFKVGFKKL
eukprot:gene8944-893_t